jgi:hypothetical protein
MWCDAVGRLTVILSLLPISIKLRHYIAGVHACAGSSNAEVTFSDVEG